MGLLLFHPLPVFPILPDSRNSRFLGMTRAKSLCFPVFLAVKSGHEVKTEYWWDFQEVSFYKRSISSRTWAPIFFPFLLSAFRMMG